MAEVRISAEPRTEFGKGPARRARRAGKLPAVLYGHGTDPRHICLVAREFEHALRRDGINVLLDLQLDGRSELALPKSVQRDPVRGVIEHVDLILVRRGEKITVEVPVVVEGTVVPGGLLDQQTTTVSITAEATHLPQHVTVDVDGLEIGGSIHAGEIKLPPGSELAGDPEQVVVHILPAPTAEQLEGEVAEAEAELGAGPAAEAPPAGETGESGDTGPAGEAGAGEGEPAGAPAQS